MRQRLVEAATTLFVTQGYAATSSREVARAAGVSHTLVNYYFGSKEGLFAEVMAINLRPSAVIAQAFSHADLGPLGLAQNIVATALALWDQPDVRASLVGLLGGAMGDDTLRASIAEFFGDEILGHIRAEVAALGPRPMSDQEAGRRAAGVASVMAGLIFTRYVLRVEPLASMPARELVRLIAPSIAVHLR